MTSAPSLQDVITYFDRKTISILDRYGPGPRVHYHTGLVDSPLGSHTSVPQLKRALVEGQELMLRQAVEAWDASTRLSGEILDVGCGLGGGAIFWAQEFSAEVTAVTCVPSHGELVARFATEAGVGSKVRPLVCDAALVPGENRFDAVVAVDSSGYLARDEWFARMAALLRPGGSVFIIDCFLEDLRYAELFNRHWRTRIGTIGEYRAAARESGLRSEAIADVTGRTVHFWTTTLALMEAESKSAGGAATDESRYAASRQAHGMVRDGLMNGGLRYALIAFAKGSGRNARIQPSFSAVEISS